MKRCSIHKTFVIIAAFFCSLLAYSQSSEQKALEQKRARLQKEIKEINRLLLSEKKEKGNVIEQVEALDKKINVRQQLIRVTNQQSNLLNRQINANIRNVTKLREDLKLLKEDYAKLILKSYQSKTQNNRLMFLLSSDGFFEAYKRFQYMKQYTAHRKAQGEKIAQRTNEILKLNIDLTEQRKAKDALVSENTRVKNDLYREINAQKDLLKSIRQNETKYAAAMSEKKKEARRIDREIERLIRSAIASSNKRTGSRSANSFVLTPEAKMVADNFSSNKGKLIWPVEKGIKSQGFGVYADKVYPGIKHQNNGVIIATDEGETARAIFEGEVITIFTNKMGVKGVYLRHGNYISMYYNLSSVFVKKGDKVATKEALGDIYTNRLDGSTKLKFYLYRDTDKLNPEEWIYQL